MELSFQFEIVECLEVLEASVQMHDVHEHCYLQLELLLHCTIHLSMQYVRKISINQAMTMLVQPSIVYLLKIHQDKALLTVLVDVSYVQRSMNPRKLVIVPQMHLLPLFLHQHMNLTIKFQLHKYFSLIISPMYLSL